MSVKISEIKGCLVGKKYSTGKQTGAELNQWTGFNMGINQQGQVKLTLNSAKVSKLLEGFKVLDVPLVKLSKSDSLELEKLLNSNLSDILEVDHEGN